MAQPHPQQGPSAADLGACVQVLQALSDPRRPDHRATVESLPGLVQQSGFVLLLLHIFGSGAQYAAFGVTVELRQMAGMMVKNYCIGVMGRDPAAAEPTGLLASTFRESILIGLMDDKSQEIRKTAASLLGRMASAYTHPYWSSVMPHLIAVLQIHAAAAASGTLPAAAAAAAAADDDASSPMASSFAIDGVMHAIVILLEDTTAKLVMDPNRPLDALVPLLMDMFSPNCSESTRLGALTALNSLILSPEGDALYLNIARFLGGLGALAVDPSPQVRRAVCNAIVLLVSHRPATLQPCFPDVCAFMLRALVDPDESVGMEACDFWLTLLQEEQTHAVLLAHLSVLVPSCLSRLRLTQAQLDRETEDEDAQADGSKRVRFHSVSRRGGGGSRGSDEEDVQYTVRKQCAFLLDNLAVAFPHGTLPLAAPLIWACLQNEQNDVFDREAALLGLGAIANGCSQLMSENMGSIMPSIMSSLQDPLQETRAGACWCLSRYVDWVQDLLYENEAQGQGALNAMVQGLLTSMQDSRPKVQAAATSALSSLLAAIDSEYLRPYTEQIVARISSAWVKYGLKNRLLLMDAIGETCRAVGGEMNDARITALYLPHLTAFLQEHSSSLGKDDSDGYLVIPPLECLAELFINVPEQVLSIAQGTVYFCLQLVERFVADRQRKAVSVATNADQDQEEFVEDDEYVTDTLVTALTLLSSMIEGLKASSAGLLALPAGATSVGEVLKHHVVFCVADSNVTVQSAAFELIGELAQSNPAMLFPACATQIFTAIVGALTREAEHDSSETAPDLFQLRNNAVWALGLGAFAMGDVAMEPYRPHLVHQLVQLVLATAEVEDGSDQDDPLLKANLCITFGRFLLVSPAPIAAILSDVLGPLLRFAKDLSPPTPNSESAQCWSGLLLAIQSNPALLTDDHLAKDLFGAAVKQQLLENNSNSSDDEEVDPALRRLASSIYAMHFVA